MDYKPKGDVSKLPQWAKLYLDALVRRVGELELQINGLNTDGGNISWETGLDEPHGLPEGVTVTFKTPDGDIDCRIGKYPHQETVGALIVSSPHSISVSPRASNSITISAKR